MIANAKIIIAAKLRSIASLRRYSYSILGLINALTPSIFIKL